MTTDSNPGLEDMYREVVMDHYRQPRGRTAIPSPDVTNVGFNPLCGDEIHIALKFTDGKVSAVQTSSHGCSISIASGSIMAEILKGKTREEAAKLIEAVRAVMRGEPGPAGVDMGDLEALRGVRKYPVRVKCALLPWMTLKDALEGGGEKPVTTEDEGPRGRLD